MVFFLRKIFIISKKSSIITLVKKMKVINKIKNFSYFLPIVYFILGILMIIFPGTINNIINYIIGGLLTLFGLDYIIRYLRNNKVTIYSKYGLIVGIVPIICGVFLICNPNVLASIIPFIAGMIILMDAIEKIKHAIDLKKLNLDEWWIDLIISILFMVFGIVIIINPFKTAKLLIRILGIFFLVDCFIDVWNNFSYEKIKIKEGKTKEIIVIDEKNE